MDKFDFKFYLVTTIVLLSILAAYAQTNSNTKKVINISQSGLVPDSITATKVAEIILKPIYGNIVEEQKPFAVKLVDSIWIVEGVLKDKLGGELYIEIQKKDCKIVDIRCGR